MLFGFLKKDLATGNNHVVRIQIDGRSRGYERFVRPRPKHVAGIRMIERNLLCFEVRDRRHDKEERHTQDRLLTLAAQVDVASDVPERFVMDAT